jgi:hypothetical protein
MISKNGKLHKLSEVSSIAVALMNKSEELDVDWVFYPED